MIQRIPEDHHVAALNRLKAIDKFIDEDPLLVGEQRRHAGAFDFYGLVEKDDDDQGEADGNEQIAICIRFHNISSRASIDDFSHQLIGIMQGEDHDFGFGRLFPYLPCRFKPVQIRHADIHHHDVGLMLFCECNGFASSGSFGAHHPSRARR